MGEGVTKRELNLDGEGGGKSGKRERSLPAISRSRFKGAGTRGPKFKVQRVGGPFAFVVS